MKWAAKFLQASTANVQADIIPTNDVALVEVFVPDCGKLRTLRITRAIFQSMARLPFVFHTCLLGLRNLSVHRHNSSPEQTEPCPCSNWQRVPDHATCLRIDTICGVQTGPNPPLHEYWHFSAGRIRPRE